MTCNTAQKHTPIDKASPRRAGEVPPPAARERRAHTAAHSRCSQAGAAQKRQRQRLPRSGARELGGHGMTITSRPEPGGPGARQARADEICSHTPQRPRPLGKAFPKLSQRCLCVMNTFVNTAKSPRLRFLLQPAVTTSAYSDCLYLSIIGSQV